MTIACVYCNGQHDNAAEVRQCWTDNDGTEATPRPQDQDNDQWPAAEVDVANLSWSQPPERDEQGSSGQRTGTTRKTLQRTTALTVRRGVAPAGAGPEMLGRHAIVIPGQDVPSPWQAASRLSITSDTLEDPNPVLDQLRTTHHHRQRVVIELACTFDDDPLSSSAIAPYGLGPRFAFLLDELHHLVWANSVDLRQPSTPTWIGLDLAIAAGASAVSEGPGDIVLPDGKSVWLDGGPVRFTDPIDGLSVLHTVAVEHRSLRPPSSNRSDADLAPDQLAAVTHTGGAARIIAPAGSGKTRVLTERARHLLTQWNLPASAVSLVAFNKRAQEEMTDRTADLPDLQVRTLNSIGLAIVNGTAPFAPQPERWRTLDEPAVRQIIGKIVSFPRRRNADPVAPWIEALSLIRLGLIKPEEAEQGYDGDVDGLADAWPKYRDALERQRSVDFDDQIYRAVLVLLTQPEARRVAQRACRLMLVDEFQDLTPAHLLLIRLLAGPGGAVFGVGDDDQTIYGYNGADPGWLIDFEQLFPGSGAHPLEVNYRCPAGIVDAVGRLLRHNRRRVPKTIRAASTDPSGWTVDPSHDPVGATVAAVTDAMATGAAANDIAVLTRVNATLAPAQVALVAAGVRIASGVGLEFVNRTAVRAVLAWIRLATSGHGGPSRFATDDVREALLRPSRSFHPRISDWIAEQGSISDLERLAGRLNTQKDTDRLLEFAGDIETVQALVRNGATTSEIVDAVISTIGLAGAVNTLDANRRGMNRAAQSDDLTAMQHLAALHEKPTTFGSWLRDQLAVPRSPDGVTLSTAHRVKGQEWPHVVVHLAESDQYPHRLAEDVEEERRLFHVAITRASVHATIVTGGRPSPFVAELTTEPSADHVVAPHLPEVMTTKSASRSGAKADPTAGLDADQQRRYEALCDLRHQLRDGKPAYVVFDNKTAAAIARSVPSTPQGLLSVPGIGPAKVEKYGDAIIALLATL